jgi:hypothetical protein
LPFLPAASRDEAANYVRRAVQTLRNLRVSGGGPPYQQTELRGTVTYTYSGLDAWMASNTKYSTSDRAAKGRAHDPNP